MEDWLEVSLAKLKTYGNRRVGSLNVEELEDLNKNWMAWARMFPQHLKADDVTLYRALEAALNSHGLDSPPLPGQYNESTAVLKQKLSASPKQDLKPPPPLAPLQPKPEEIPMPPPAPIARRGSPVSNDPRQEKVSAPKIEEEVLPMPAVEQIVEEADRPEHLPVVQEEDEQLNFSKRTRLAQLERTVEKGLATFVATGRALAAIRDERLYLLTHRTFESYCRERLALAVGRARQLMLAAEVVTNLEDLDTASDESITIATDVAIVPPNKSVMEDSTVILPTSERQARALWGLGSEQQRQVWQKSVEAAGGTPTEQQVQEIRHQLFPQSKAKPRKTAKSQVGRTGQKSPEVQAQGGMEGESINEPAVSNDSRTPEPESYPPYQPLLDFLQDLKVNPENYDFEISIDHQELMTSYGQVRARLLRLIDKLEPK
jgi:hypothetical protein